MSVLLCSDIKKIARPYHSAVECVLIKATRDSHYKKQFMANMPKTNNKNDFDLIVLLLLTSVTKL